MFLTFTADATAFGERAADFLLFVKKQRALGHALRLLKRWGWIEHSCRVGEFQENGMIHYHAIVDAVRGYIPHHIISKAWNRARNRPEWAGPVTAFETGERAGELRPVVGFVAFTRPDWGPGPDGKIVSPVVRYVCGYIAKAGKNPHPQWFEDLCDGKIDGKRHNAQLFSSSRGFFEGVRMRRPGRRPGGAPRARRPRRRLTVRERLQSCREPAKLMMRFEHHIDGEILRTDYVYVGTFGASPGYGTACYGMFPRQVADVVSHQRGVWLEPRQVDWLLSSRVFRESFRAARGSPAKNSEGAKSSEEDIDASRVAAQQLMTASLGP